VHRFYVDNVAATVLFADLDMALTETTSKPLLLGDDAWAGYRRVVSLAYVSKAEGARENERLTINAKCSPCCIDFRRARLPIDVFRHETAVECLIAVLDLHMVDERRWEGFGQHCCVVCVEEELPLVTYSVSLCTVNNVRRGRGLLWRSEHQ